MGTSHEPLAALVLSRCRELALQDTDTPDTITRLFLSPGTARAHARLTRWMQAANLEVSTDAAGNLRALRPGPTPESPRLILASHLDTVPNAGPFDGLLGILLGLALLEDLRTTPLPCAVELIAFSEEEGVRFTKPFLGSLALVGQLTPADLTRTDANGTTLAEAVRAFGLDPAHIPAAKAHPATAAYLELHIEQGPVLEHANRSLGIVTAIVGQSRLALTFRGHANHAGTTPMGPLRHDALAAAATFIVEAERYASATPGLRATVGKLETPGGAGNVISGFVHTTLDLRHPDDATRHTALTHLLAFAAHAASTRGVTFAHTTTMDQPAVPMDPRLTQLLSRSVAETTCTPALHLPSGAGHDAQVIAPYIPSAMLFLRSPGGLSHHPEESVLPEDVAAALAAARHFLLHLAL